MKTAVYFILVIASLYFLYVRFIKYPYAYVGYYYPDIENMDKWIESEPFSSLDECRKWKDQMIMKHNYSTNKLHDYECGKNCYMGDPYNQGNKYTCNTSVD